MTEIDLQLTGSLNWKQLRKVIIKEMKESSTEEEFLEVIKAIIFSASDSEEEMQEKRRFFGIPET